MSGRSKIKRRLDTAMLALARADRGADAAVREWRLHNLRRTCATNMAELGIPPHPIEVALNHVSGHKASVAGIYNRATYAAEKAAALTLWADHLRTIIEGGARKVLPLRSRIAAQA